MSPGERRNMIQPGHPKLSLSAQCRVLNISRSTLYYRPLPASVEELALLKAIDKLFTKYPFFGSRQITSWLARDGIKVGRHRVRRLMRQMGLQAVYRRPKTSQPHPAHPIYPYLLKGLEITRPNQVWCADITFVPVSRGYLYLVAIMDWATRKVLSWRVSNSEPLSAIGPRTMASACRLLCGRAERGHREIRPAGDHEHGSGKPVHGIRLDHHAHRGEGPGQYGREGPVHGQHLHRTSLAIPQI